jgi:hypothetical protein
LDTAKYFKARCRRFSKKNRPEEETNDVMRMKEEFDS